MLMVSSASAAPLLSLGSNANYALNASIQTTQSCNASPASYNQTACGPYQPMALVHIYDNGTCISTGYSCYFWPANITVSPGTTVMWINDGKMTHTVTSSSGVAGFSSGYLAPMASFSFTFSTIGNYGYYCSIHPWLHGTVIVSGALPVPTPVSSSFMPKISLAGSVNWTVNGLDNSVAVLNISHQVSIIASANGFSFTPVTETGSFSQSVNLSTRVESPGTATSLIGSIVQRMLAYLGSTGYYYGGFSPALSQMLSDPKTVYTIWWVNGPLSNGQPVQVLTGYSSVIGSEIVNLGPGDNRNAWIVESELSQSVSVITPPINGPGGSSDSSFRLDLRFDYDQASDLLLRASAVISIQSSQTQMYSPGQYLCGASGCFPVSVPVTVTRQMSANIPVTLQLTSTNLDLSRRMPTGSIGNGQTSTGGPGGTSGTSTLPPASSLWIYAGVGIAGAGVVGTLAWLLRRGTRIRAPVAQPGPLPGPSPTVSSA
jgi:plastocyanin